MSEDRIRELVEQMTLAEQVSLLSGGDFWSVPAIPRLGIHKLRVTDGPNGARGGGGLAGGVKSAAFPVGIALGASWNPALVKEIGGALADEVKSKGAHVSLSPTVNIHRSVTNGRNFECYSEDPVLTAQLAGAFIAGLQEQGIGATIKHFAGNESEIERTSIDSMVDERALREVYLYPFEYAVKIAGTWGIMSSYNKLNGVFASENEWLLGQVLRHEWKYAGVVMSDWFGSHSTAPAINAGLDLEMPGPTRDRGQKLLDAVNAGEVSAATIQLRATNVLRLADRTGAIDDERSGDEHADDRQVHRALIRRAGAEAAVLLKNDGLLPLDPATLGKIAVIGPNAKVAQIMGGGSAQLNPHYAVSPWQGLEAKFGEDRLIFAPGATNQRFEPEAEQRDEETIAAAAAAARSAEVAIVCVGRNGEWDREGADLEDIRLPGRQDELVSAVARANPRTIVVLQTGGPVEMPWRDEVAAILEAWYPGQEAGNAIADVLTGAAEPGGRLPQSFPARWNDNPVHSQDREIYPGLNGRMRYEEGVFIGYRHYDRRGIAPMFPFGFGLSYTSFELTDLAIDASRFEAAGAVRAYVSVTNTGARAGSEVVQLYVGDEASSVPRPVKELKAFAKLALAPGETRRITLDLGPRDFAFYNVAGHNWVVEPGSFALLVGISAADIKLSGQVRRTTTMTLAV